MSTNQSDLPKWRHRVDRIMDDFDFAKVARTMKFLEWDWIKLDDNYKLISRHIPNEAVIRKRARELLIDAINYDIRGVCSAGGFEARRDGEFLSLAFKLEESDAGDLEEAP